PLTFFSLLAQMRDAGCEYAVMEVSSHGLDQKRTGPCRFLAGIFTNSLFIIDVEWGRNLLCNFFNLFFCNKWGFHK
ncbi:MAG: hypothetical protein IKW81_01190, partial [Pseudobutyrivibrio sp.]|nr:hypothetical protein [Pseudobutyrivibrio sp.]